MSETSTARVHAWEAVIESDSTTVAGTHAGYHTTTLMAGPGSGKSHFLLRVPFLLATFYKEQAQHESARNVQKIVSSFLTPPQHPQATMTCYMPIGFPLADGSVIAGQAMTLTSTTLSIPRSCTTARRTNSAHVRMGNRTHME